MKAQAVGSLLIGFCLCSGFGQSAPTPVPEPETTQAAGPGPVQAELFAHLDVRRLSKGATVLARTTLEWDGPDCTLRNGAILEGTVEVADAHKGRNDSKLAISFNRAQCNGVDLKPMKLMLAAVSGPPSDWTIVPNAEFRMPMTTLMANGQQNAGFGGTVINNFSAPTLQLTGVVHRFPMGPKVQPGAVIEIRGMKLDLGTGPNQSSILATKGRDVTLDEYSQLLLVPNSLVFFPTAGTHVAADPAVVDGTPTRAAVATPAPVPVNDLDVCAPPGCAVDLPVNAKEVEGRNAGSIAMEPLGYAPRLRKVLGEFGDEETLTWLGPKQLLVAFNTHPLIHRSRIPGSGAPHRVIRAVLLDAESRSIERVVDWEITDTRRFLWPLDRNRILVHIGNELRVYGADLEIERTIPLSGPLSFVRIAPNGELLAVATLHERHSSELHTKLRDDLGNEPEEDIDVVILDKGFNTVGQALTTSGLQPPTLLNEGQVKLLAQPNMHYRLALSTWDNKSVTLARFASRCTPELSSVAPDLLFLLSCDVATGSTAYRVIGSDGKLLLRGEAGPRDVGHEVKGNHGSARFAIKVVRATHDLSPGIEFKSTELESEEIRVYRASDGKRVMAVRVTEPVASHDSYALSPDGDQLAILSEAQIKFFPVPTN